MGEKDASSVNNMSVPVAANASGTPHPHPPRQAPAAPCTTFRPQASARPALSRPTSGRGAAIPFAAPVGDDCDSRGVNWRRARRDGRHPPLQFARPMPPSAPPLYEQQQQQHQYGGRYQVTVDVDPRYLDAAWPGEDRRQWAPPPPPPAYVPRGIVTTEREVDLEAIPFFSNSASSDNDQSSQRRQRREGQAHRTDSLKAFASSTARLTMFHLLNSCLGFAACSVVTSGASLGLSTLAMCCLGILVFRILFYVVYAFAQFDMMLGNYVAPPDKFMYAVIPPFDGQGVLTGYRLAPTLACFSPLSLMALLYFCSVKVGIATLSTIAVGLFLVPPITFVVSWATGYAVPIQYFGIDEVSVHSDPVGFTLSVVCLTLLGLALLHVVANLSLLATRFFVCERFTVQRYPPPYPNSLHDWQRQHPIDPRYHHHRQHHHPRRERQPIYPVAVVSYGAA